MATIRDGNRPVLLVVDVQTGVVHNAWDAPRIIKNIRQVVEKARSQNTPIVWVQHGDQELVQGSAAWQIVPELSPQAGDWRIEKQFNSSFEQTPLDKILADLGATRIILVGAATNWCIRATAYAALDRGYDLTLIKDAHTTETIVFEDGSRIEAADIILELNVAMKWLSYPGRANTTETTEALTFRDGEESQNP